MIEFVKMHGLGNDFVIIDKESIPHGTDISELARQISNRHTGIGCDQLILYKVSSSSEYDMYIYNQDGSEAEACGNATRCITKLAYLKTDTKKLSLNILGRKIDCKVISEDKIEVNMGHASFDKKWMPKAENIWEITAPYQISPRDIMCVDIGNPHLVIITDNPMPMQDKFLLGELLEKHTLFPDGVNVNFVNIKDNDIYLQVWERGAGFTLACGSGACASFAAAHKLGFIETEAKVKFSVGSLEMVYSDGDIHMSGPANVVATGVYHDQKS